MYINIKNVLIYIYIQVDVYGGLKPNSAGIVDGSREFLRPCLDP